jgi:pantothenate kinase
MEKYVGIENTVLSLKGTTPNCRWRLGGISAGFCTAQSILLLVYKIIDYNYVWLPGKTSHMVKISDIELFISTESL